jgi:hypothetical protein
MKDKPKMSQAIEWQCDVVIYCDQCGRVVDAYKDIPAYAGLYDEEKTLCWRCKKGI